MATVLTLLQLNAHKEAAAATLVHDFCSRILAGRVGEGLAPETFTRVSQEVFESPEEARMFAAEVVSLGQAAMQKNPRGAGLFFQAAHICFTCELVLRSSATGAGIPTDGRRWQWRVATTALMTAQACEWELFTTDGQQDDSECGGRSIAGTSYRSSCTWVPARLHLMSFEAVIVELQSILRRLVSLPPNCFNICQFSMSTPALFRVTKQHLPFEDTLTADAVDAVAGLDSPWILSAFPRITASDFWDETHRMAILLAFLWAHL